MTIIGRSADFRRDVFPRQRSDDTPLERSAPVDSILMRAIGIALILMSISGFLYAAVRVHDAFCIAGCALRLVGQ